MRKVSWLATDSQFFHKGGEVKRGKRTQGGLIKRFAKGAHGYIPVFQSKTANKALQ